MGTAIATNRLAPGMARQLERFREALAGGMPRRGWKIGINVPEVLRHLELPHSAVAWIDGRRVVPSGAELAWRPEARLHAEPEIAIRVGDRVPAGASPETARGCIASLHPALEIVSYAERLADLDDVLACCMFHDATVLGPPAPLEAVRGLGAEWPALRVGERSADPPRADLVPDDLGGLLAFAAAYLDVFGESLEPDDLVLSGSYCARAAPLVAGEEVVAEFGPAGRVCARVSPPAGGRAGPGGPQAAAAPARPRTKRR